MAVSATSTRSVVVRGLKAGIRMSFFCQSSIAPKERYHDTGRKEICIREDGIKHSPVTVYLGKRDFIDHLTHVDPVEGVVLVDAEYVKGRKVFIHLLCAFRHGRDGDEFHGIDWHRDLFLNTKQVYPPSGSMDESASHSKISRLQERLIRKLGPDSYPFTFKVEKATSFPSSAATYTSATLSRSFGR
ncbi:unnamed protein product [Hydatigera taeniaeformis]|uniref:Arrestin_N domain-containing protein n=1 Tax=Hydatigena taeniaeformis TaxID=6205 RepID=A0A0R3WIV8_HYDTA|nr:unnamed protein product [Hydatigera taeniaeformis]